MRRDPGAKAAYAGMRKRGMSKDEAEHEIEVAYERSFWEVLFVGVDRRLEIWIALEEGLRAGSPVKLSPNRLKARGVHRLICAG